MPKSKKRRKLLVFSAIAVVVAGLFAFAILKKRDPVITVQSEKVARRNLIELVTANGKIQPVLQVKISPEVSGEITELPIKEGQCVSKGDLILKIKPDFYTAQRNQADASYKSAVAGKESAEASLRKTEAEFKRQQDLFDTKLISDSAFDEAKAAYDMAKAQLSSADHQVDMAQANLERSEEELAKTTIVSPLAGTISKLDSRLGERVVGTATMAGTEVMTIADLNEMEARVDIGEMDVILIRAGQNVRLEVDAFKDRKFTGTVTEIANSSKTQPGAGAQEATKFEVKIRIQEKEAFRPGMSVTAEIETRSRTNVLSVPIASVTTRLPKEKNTKTNSTKGTTHTNAAPVSTNVGAAVATSSTNGTLADSATGVASADTGTNGATGAKGDKKPKPIEVVFLLDGDHAKMMPVKIGISDENYWEITDGLKENDEVISGGFRAISRDLEDGKKIRKGRPVGDQEKEKETGARGNRT
jgi:HlyD family secretion protein